MNGYTGQPETKKRPRSLQNSSIEQSSKKRPCVSSFDRSANFKTLVAGVVSKMFKLPHNAKFHSTTLETLTLNVDNKTVEVTSELYIRVIFPSEPIFEIECTTELTIVTLENVLAHVNCSNSVKDLFFECNYPILYTLFIKSTFWIDLNIISGMK